MGGRLQRIMGLKRTEQGYLGPTRCGRVCLFILKTCVNNSLVTMTWDPMVRAGPVRFPGRIMTHTHNKAISFHAKNQHDLFVRFDRHSVGKIQC